MKVKHLIRELGKCDPEAIVNTEGCDCWGDTMAVEVRDDGEILIRRSDGCEGWGKGSPGPYEDGDDTPKPLP